MPAFYDLILGAIKYKASIERHRRRKIPLKIPRSRFEAILRDERRWQTRRWVRNSVGASWLARVENEMAEERSSGDDQYPALDMSAESSQFPTRNPGARVLERANVERGTLPDTRPRGRCHHDWALVESMARVSRAALRHSRPYPHASRYPVVCSVLATRLPRRQLFTRLRASPRTTKYSIAFNSTRIRVRG